MYTPLVVSFFGRSTQEIINSPEVEIPYLCDTILPIGSTVLMSGEAGAGKSIMALNLAYCLALGHDFFGHAVSASVPVYYLNLEQPSPQFDKRVKQVVRALGAEEARVQVHTELSPDFPGCLGNIIEAVRKLQPKVIIIDTLVKLACNYDENRAGDMAKFFNVLSKVRADPDVVLIILHHMNKSAFVDGARVQSSYRVRGSSAILAAVDNCFSIEKQAENKHCLAAVKLRDAPNMASLDFSINADYTISPVTPINIAANTVARVHETVRLAGSAGITPKTLVTTLKLSESSVHRGLRDGQVRGVLVSSDGVWRAKNNCG